MPEPAPYTPERLRALAGRVYRLGHSFGLADLREVGDYLGRSAAAADEQGDILQQHAAAKAELARLQQAVAEADAARIERDSAIAERDAARAERDRLRRMAAGLMRDIDALRTELDGQRLWYHLAVEWVRELRPLIAPDKQTLIDPMAAAAVARSHRQLLAEALPLLRRLRDWASLHAQVAADDRCLRDVRAATALLESDACRKSSQPKRSST